MSLQQGFLLGLLALMMVLFTLERLRTEVVAIAGLLAGYALGLYPAEAVFSGFASPVVITVVEILLIVQVLARAEIFGWLTGRLVAAEASAFTVVAALAGATAFLSVFMNNIGAFAIALPAALRIGDRTPQSHRRLIMPISFAALLGGLVSLIGTPANLIVSRALQEKTGHGFAFFDFAYVGLPVAAAGVVFLAFLVPRLFAPNPAARLEERSDAPTADRRFIFERRIPRASALVGLSPPRLRTAFGLETYAVIRDGRFVFAAADKIVTAAGDILLAEASEAVLAELERGGLLSGLPHPAASSGEFARGDAVIMPESTLVGSRIRSLEVFTSRGVAVTGLAARARRIEGRFEDLRLSIGDILRLEGPRQAIDDALAECDSLLLAPADTPQPSRRARLGALFFAAGIAVSAFGIATPDISFAGVILAMTLANLINLRRAMADINWPIVIMLAAMIPLGAAVATTGTAEMLTAALSARLPVADPAIGVALVLFLGMAITPFVNNATVAIVLTPVAFELAAKAAHAPQPYLIAVAAGASLDFTTPFGHHNNTLTMSIGNYRFVDFLRGGLPLAVFCYGLALALICGIWL